MGTGARARALPWVAAVVVAGAAAVLGVRRGQTRWGTTAAEAARPLPGDEIVEVPQYAATNAITIDAGPDDVWPWLVQMGAYGRAGWYSFDRLDNGGVPSARAIVPELQDLRVGDVLATDRDGRGFLVEAVDPSRSLVLSIRASDAVTSAVFVLEPVPGRRTRLLLRVRVRTAASVRGRAYRLLMEVGHVVMTWRMLTGIRTRAEQGKRREDRMKATLVAFGAIEIDGTRYEHDVVIDRGEVHKRRKSASKAYRGHYGHTPLSPEENIPWHGKRLIVGTGANGALPVMPELTSEAHRRGVEVTALPTEDACRLIEGLRRSDVNAVLHVTC